MEMGMGSGNNNADYMQIKRNKKSAKRLGCPMSKHFPFGRKEVEEVGGGPKVRIKLPMAYCFLR